MPKKLLPLLLLALLAPAATASAQSVVSTPSKKVLYNDGLTGRYLMDGPWLFRLDPRRTGTKRGFHSRATTAGWTRTTVPNAWNATDESLASMRGSVGWYRKDFRLPNRNRALDWIVRFESANYRVRAWINGREIGRHRGAYLPFEMVMRRGNLRSGVNRLVVRVDSVRRSFDLPPAGFSRNALPKGGWWNYGGLLREVYIRPVRRVAIDSVQVLPHLSCRTCTATVEAVVRVKNVGRSAARAGVSGRFAGRSIRFRSKTVPRGGRAVLRGRIRVANPRLWSPKSPTLYDAAFNVRVGGKAVDGYRTKTGIRVFKVINGRLTLNFLPIQPRGFGMHEDQRQRGFALTNADRDALIQEVRDAGGTMVRAHYPLHPYTYEQLDRLGMLAWSEIPMYGTKSDIVARGSVRRFGAELMRQNVATNANHPSIAIWSTGNELNPKPYATQAEYHLVASRVARAMDGTRPVGYAVQAFRSAGCQRNSYRGLQVIGLNEYYGWYVGTDGEIADRSFLSGYLDQARRCYPDKALMITEFGFEANRHGPSEERGTYEAQDDLIRYHTGIFATKPWLSGMLYWTIREFRVKPRWDGGNPRPQAPIHQKGIIDFDGNPKPAFQTVKQLFSAADQYPGQ